MPPLGNPGTDTTHERATPRGEPRAWYKRKVNTLPQQLIRGWDAWVGAQKIIPLRKCTPRRRTYTMDYP